MENVNRTIYAAHLQTCMILKKPFTVLPNSTLNQKFGVHADQAPSTMEYPHLGYMAIGNKGTTYDVAPGGYLLTTPIPHLARHAAAYNFLPFIVRAVDDDISSSERLLYRMRTLITLGGAPHVAYYLRKIDLENATPTVELRNVNDGVITNTPFTPEISDLTPVHPTLSNPNLNTPNGDYLVSSAKTNFILNESDIANIMEACMLIYGDPRYAVINEIMLVSGLDKNLPGQFGSVVSNYTEVIAAQVAAFISQNHILTSSTQEVNIGLSVGSPEPLLV
jgi:hypothetical protein